MKALKVLRKLKQEVEIAAGENGAAWNRHDLRSSVSGDLDSVQAHYFNGKSDACEAFLIMLDAAIKEAEKP